MAQELTENHRALKALVIGMAVLIVISLAMIVTTIIYRLSHQADSAGLPPATSLALPAGSRALSASTADGRITLLLEDGGGGQSLLVLDAATGKRLSLIALAPGADTAGQ